MRGQSGSGSRGRGSRDTRGRACKQQPGAAMRGWDGTTRRSGSGCRRLFSRTSSGCCSSARGGRRGRRQLLQGTRRRRGFGGQQRVVPAQVAPGLLHRAATQPLLSSLPCTHPAANAISRLNAADAPCTTRMLSSCGRAGRGRVRGGAPQARRATARMRAAGRGLCYCTCLPPPSTPHQPTMQRPTHGSSALRVCIW